MEESNLEKCGNIFSRNRRKGEWMQVKKKKCYMVSEEEVLFLRVKEQVQDLRTEERLGNVTVGDGKICN